MANYSIKDLERLSGIKAHTIRMWEQRYGLLQPQRTDTNIRTYDDSQLKRLLNVTLLVENGYKISKVSKLDQDEFHDTLRTIQERAMEQWGDESLEVLANGLMAAMIDFDEPRFGQLFATGVLRRGFLPTIEQLIYPFLEKVGILWSLGQLHPAHEHFVSHLIRQKLIVAIDGLPIAPKESRRFVLFLPEGEYHELGLLIAHYILRSYGMHVTYLGQNVPYDDLAQVVEAVQPHVLQTFLVTQAPINQTNNMFGRLDKDFPNQEVLFSGPSSLVAQLSVPGRFRHLDNMSALSSFLVE